MKERPILFSGPMVLAILEGRKTQTRRVILPQPTVDDLNIWPYHDHEACWLPSKFGGIGDRLWVRETHRPFEHPEIGTCVQYRADESVMKPVVWPDENTGWRWEQMANALDKHKWQPSIFMPRWASRILLEIVDVRVERVRDISEADARAEGCRKPYSDLPTAEKSRSRDRNNAVSHFSWLWDSINAKRGYAWKCNPWVWVVQFRRVES